MRNEVLQESLSALMDNEADELEVRRVLQAADQDPALRSTWARYQMARSVMHKEPWQGSVDLSAGIAAALKDEPALQMESEQAAPAVTQGSVLWRNFGRVAVAASVTLAVLVGVRMVNQGDAPTQPMTAATSPAPSMLQANPAARPGAVLAGYSQTGTAAAEPLAPAQGPSAWHEQRISRYLREHAEAGAQSNTPQLVPYARAASMEGR